MRQFLTVVMILGALWLGSRLVNYMRAPIPGSENPTRVNANAPAPGKLAGMPAFMEAGLDQARSQGATGLATWLSQHRREVGDPRLAEIELEYVVLVGPTDRAEAKRALEYIGKRIKPDSPVYQRYEQLRKNYE
ncbi:MAG: hypothetical protein KDM81_01305 [Verrucomicrobiae bacterium]|nr:hypothetical protein [Verrucomicrobiae bacterium]MCP5520720.1 hypothetical protein [Verrucomicrobiales bacterium]